MQGSTVTATEHSSDSGTSAPNGSPGLGLNVIVIVPLSSSAVEQVILHQPSSAVPIIPSSPKVQGYLLGPRLPEGLTAPQPLGV